MWPLTWKCFLRFAVFTWIAVCTQCISHSNRLGICLNSLGYPCSGCPCEENLPPFERLGLSMQKKFAWVRTGWGWGCLFEKIVTCSKKCRPFERLDLSVQRKNFSRVSISQNNFITSHSSLTRYSWEVTLRSLFTNTSWIITYLFLLLYSHLRFPYYHSIIDSINTQFIQYLPY